MPGQRPPQALCFSHRRGERETRVKGDELQGTMGRVQMSPLSPSCLPLRAHFHRERERERERETSGYEAVVPKSGTEPI